MTFTVQKYTAMMARLLETSLSSDVRHTPGIVNVPCFSDVIMVNISPLLLRNGW